MCIAGLIVRHISLYIVLELESLKDRHWKIVACSAVSGAGLIDGVDWVVNDIASRIYTLA
jgi:ADP-ribosylation factor-like protein 2